MLRYVIPSVVIIGCLHTGTTVYAQTTSVKVETERKREPIVKGTYTSITNGKTVIVQNDDKGPTYRLEVEGEVSIADDERSITALTQGGRFEYSRQSKGEAEHKIVLKNNSNGQLEGKYWIDDVAQDYATAGKAWLAQYLPEMISKTGIGAAERAERLFKEGGITKVLSFTATMPDGMGRSKMYRYLLEKETLTVKDKQAVVEQIAQARIADYELATMLTGISTSLLQQAGIATAYIKAASAINSDYEKARTLKHLLSQEQLPAAVLEEVAKSIGTISSDYEQVGVLTTLASRPQLTDQPFLFAMQSMQKVSSDYERGKGLTSLLKHEQQVVTHFNKLLPLIKTMSSDYEKAKVYAALLNVKGFTPEYYVLLLKDSETINSDYEKSKLLQQVAQQMPKEDKEVRQAYLQTSKTINSSYEYEKAIAVYKQ